MFEIKTDGWSAEVLNPGDQLERGGVVGHGKLGVRLGGGAELVDNPVNLAGLFRVLYSATSPGGNVLPCNDPQILLVGSPSRGYKPFGPFPMDDPDGMAHARIRRMEEQGDELFEQMPLNPLTGLEPIDPDPEPQPQPQPADRGKRDSEPVSAGLPQGTSYLVVMCDGKPADAYALRDGNMVEAYDFDGGATVEAPDWDGGSFVEPGRADDGFFYPAMALLRFLNTSAQDVQVWPHMIRANFEGVFLGWAAAGLIESWGKDYVSGGYTVGVRRHTGEVEPVTLRDPAAAQLFVDAFGGGLAAAGVQLPAPAAPPVRLDEHYNISFSGEAGDTMRTTINQLAEFEAIVEVVKTDGQRVIVQLVDVAAVPLDHESNSAVVIGKPYVDGDSDFEPIRISWDQIFEVHVC